MNPNMPAEDKGNSNVTPFLHKVGAPLVWIGVGYLLATLIQRPTRSRKDA